jgi:hypothetical protein
MLTEFDENLSSAQLKAVCLLASGESVTDTAVAVGVARQTLSGWKNHNSAFQAELARKQAEIWNESRERLRTALPKATEVLISALDDDSPRVRLSAARTVISLNGELNKPLPPQQPQKKPEFPEFKDADECFANLEKLGALM